MSEHASNPIDIPDYAPAPLVVERLSRPYRVAPLVWERWARLHGVARLLKTISAASDRDEGLETLAHVVETEAGALEHALELMGVHEQMCPDRGPLSNQEHASANV